MKLTTDEILAILQRLNLLYAEIKQSPPPPVTLLRQTLFDATARISDQERALLALIDHPHPSAADLLTHRALRFSHPRLAFTHQLALRRRSTALAETTPRAA